MKLTTTTTYGLIWIMVSVAISVGIIVSKSLMPLWTFIIPACIAPISFTDKEDE